MTVNDYPFNTKWSSTMSKLEHKIKLAELLSGRFSRFVDFIYSLINKWPCMRYGLFGISLHF